MTAPTCLPALYGPDTKSASVAVVQMDEVGQASAAAAMVVMILVATATLKLA